VDSILNPELIKAIQDNFGIISLAMLLIALVAFVLLKDAPVGWRVAILLIILGIYGGVIFTALDQNSKGGVIITPCDQSTMTWEEYRKCKLKQ